MKRIKTFLQFCKTHLELDKSLKDAKSENDLTHKHFKLIRLKRNTMLMQKGIEKDNDEIYLNNACNPPIVDINENKEGKVVLFPNPAKNNISINNLNFQGAYNISNVLGVVMMSGTYESSSLSIDVGGLKKNIYFIEIDGLILKFIKE